MYVSLGVILQQQLQQLGELIKSQLKIHIQVLNRWEWNSEIIVLALAHIPGCVTVFELKTYYKIVFGFYQRNMGNETESLHPLHSSQLAHKIVGISDLIFVFFIVLRSNITQIEIHIDKHSYYEDYQKLSFNFIWFCFVFVSWLHLMWVVGYSYREELHISSGLRL